MTKHIREQIIAELSTGQFVSGQILGESLGVTRAAVAKHIEAITEMGLDIYRVTGKGYRLAQPLNLLAQTDIVDALLLAGFENPVEVHQIIDSTNSYLLRRLPNQIQDGQVCLAEYQSDGRGRRGRQWISPYGSHIYLSMYKYLPEGMSAAMGLSIAVGLAVLDTIKQLYGLAVELKWPNDVYIEGKKLAGILVDLEGQPMEDCHCVIGIGVNLAMPEESGAKVDQPWIDLSTAIGQQINRSEFAASLISHLNKRIATHQSTGLTTMLDDWHQHDIYFNQPIKVITGERETLGISRGISDQGALLIESAGKVSPVYGGEVSLRGLA